MERRLFIQRKVDGFNFCEKRIILILKWNEGGDLFFKALFFLFFLYEILTSECKIQGQVFERFGHTLHVGLSSEGKGEKSSFKWL